MRWGGSAMMTETGAILEEKLMPLGWQPDTNDHAVNRYANRTSEFHKYAEFGIRAVVGHAYEQTGETPHWIHDFENNMRKAIVLALNGHWQNDVVEWLSEAHAFANWHEADFTRFRKNASPEIIEEHARRLWGGSIADCDEFSTIRELHLVANAVRHGPGLSLNTLKTEFPRLWEHPTAKSKLRPWYMTSDEPLPSFVITEEDLARYLDAICGLWQRISNSALKMVSEKHGLTI
jgi:hypothetical protein